MRTREFKHVIDYPVNVYSVTGRHIGYAPTQEWFIKIWNADPDNKQVGILEKGYGPTFLIKLGAHPVVPSIRDMIIVFGEPVIR